MKSDNIEILKNTIFQIELAQTVFEYLVEEEQKDLDKKSKSYQNGEKGEIHQEQIDALQEVADTLNDIISNCYSAMEEI